MSWNYRVVRFKGELDEDTYYELKEVFYNRDGSLMGYADASVGGQSYDDIVRVLDMMKKDATKVVINEEEFFAKRNEDTK